MATAPHMPNSLQQHDGAPLSPTDLLPVSVDSAQPIAPQLNIDDLRSIATDIKNALSSAISELSLDLQAMTGRIQKVEDNNILQQRAIDRIDYRIDSHNRQLGDMQRHIEELDNRGRHHNLRIRGLPESVEKENLPQTVSDVFNNILDKPACSVLSMERIHRALRPKGKESDPPRDVVCHVDNFNIKEMILRKACEKKMIAF